MQKRYVLLDEDDRIIATTIKKEWATEEYFEFDFSDEFDFYVQTDYLIQNGKLIHSPSSPDPSNQIADLKQKLSETDYVVIKVAESQLTGVPLDDERAQTYADIITQREEWREEIRKYEAELEVQNGDS